MIPYADLIGRRYARHGLGPDGPLSCLGVTLALLGRHGIPGCPGMAHTGAQEAPGSTQAEAALAAWAGAEDSPWATLEPSVGWRPQDADVLLLDADGDPAGVAVVVDAAQGLAVTSVARKGVCGLKVRMLRPRLLVVYRWRGAA